MVCKFLFQSDDSFVLQDFIQSGDCKTIVQKGFQFSIVRHMEERTSELELNK